MVHGKGSSIIWQVYTRDIYDIFTVSSKMTILVIYLFTLAVPIPCRMHGLLVVASRATSAFWCAGILDGGGFFLVEALSLKVQSLRVAQQLQHVAFIASDRRISWIRDQT